MGRLGQILLTIRAEAFTSDQLSVIGICITTFSSEDAANRRLLLYATYRTGGDYWREMLTILVSP